MGEECPVCGEQFQPIEGIHPYLDDTTLCCSVRCANELDGALAANSASAAVW